MENETRSDPVNPKRLSDYEVGAGTGSGGPDADRFPPIADPGVLGDEADEQEARVTKEHDAGMSAEGDRSDADMNGDFANTSGDGTGGFADVSGGRTRGSVPDSLGGEAGEYEGNTGIAGQDVGSAAAGRADITGGGTASGLGATG